MPIDEVVVQQESSGEKGAWKGDMMLERTDAVLEASF